METLILIIAVVKGNVSKLNPVNLLAKLQFIIESLTGNTNFTTTAPTLAELEAAETELSDAILAAADGAKSKRVVMMQAAKKVKDMISRLTSDVNTQSNGNLTKAVSSGLEARKQRQAATLAPAPTNFRAFINVGVGKIKLAWDGVKTKLVYIITMTTTPDNDNSWIPISETSKRSVIIEDLTPGTLYYFRVETVNSKGRGIPSEVIQMRCP